MNIRILCVLGLACIFAAGCGSVQTVRERVQQRWAGPVGKTHVFAATQRDAYMAAKAAAEVMGFRFLRGGPAQGEIDAISGIRNDDSMRSSRQLSMKVRLSGAGEGTEVRLILTEIIEADYNKGPGMGTENELKNSGLYDVFFKHVGDTLKHKGN